MVPRCGGRRARPGGTLPPPGREAVVVVREPARAVAALGLAESLSWRVSCGSTMTVLAGALSASTAVVSTVPTSRDPLTSAIDGPVRLVDAIYNPWPTHWPTASPGPRYAVGVW